MPDPFQRSIFISALSANPAPADFTETVLETGSADAVAFSVLQTHFTTIQQTIATTHTNWQNNPVPPPALTGGEGFYRLERTFPDNDGDGMSDAFEFKNGTDPDSNDENGDGTPDGDEDPDGDGLTNEDEELLGTDPRKDDTSENGILDGATHGWFLLNRLYSSQFTKKAPRADEGPDTSGGVYGYSGSWHGAPSSNGELSEPLDFNSLSGTLSSQVPFDSDINWSSEHNFYHGDDQLGTAGLRGSVTDGPNEGDRTYQAKLKQARVEVHTTRPVPRETNFPVLLRAGISAAPQPEDSLTGLNLTVATGSSSGVLDLTPGFTAAAPESESQIQDLIIPTTEAIIYQAGYDNFPRLLDEHYEPRPWLMVPSEAEPGNSIRLRGGALAAIDANLTTSNESAVTPTTTGNQPSLDVEVKGPATGQSATVDIQGVPLVNLAFYPRRTIKLTVHAVTLPNDDVDLVNIKPFKGLPNQPCVTKAGATFWSTPGGDDDFSSGVSTYIHTGANGICETTASGDPNNPNAMDNQEIEVGKGKPNVVFITGGPNGKINTPVDGEDEVSADNSEIHTGEDGIRHTKPVEDRISPKNLPSRQELEDFLNDVYGLQANIYFEVTFNPVDVAFDVGHTEPGITNYKKWGIDGELDIITTEGKDSAEEALLEAEAFDSSASLG